MDKSKIYVGNLPFQATEEQLHSFFSQYGNINDCKIIFDRATGRSKGFAFITFSSDEEGEAALAANSTEFEGRNLNVNTAKPVAAR